MPTKDDQGREKQKESTLRGSPAVFLLSSVLRPCWKTPVEDTVPAGSSSGPVQCRVTFTSAIATQGQVPKQKVQT